MRIAFFGTPDFAVPALRALATRHDIALVVAQPDKPAGRGMAVQVPAVARVAIEIGLSLAQPPRIRDPAFFAGMRALALDLGVVIAYGKILPRELLEVATHGFVNVHASVLPKYRGAAPIQRAIEQGESETGVTIMRLDEELDHGPILAIERTPIEPDEHAPRLAARLSDLGAALLLRTLEALSAGAIREEPQDHASATYAPKIDKSEGRIDWTMPARRMVDRFRAFDPWPGVFCDYRGQPLKLLALTRRPELPPGTAPGTVVALGRDSVDVATTDGAVRLLAVQRPGKGPVTAAELARAGGLSVGELFR